MATNILDVTQIVPQLKHPTIFKQFDALQEGEAFVIHNDHDPKPLYYQLVAERGDIFTWEYEEQGPQWWKVKIAKKVFSTGQQTIGEIAGQDLRKAEVFKKYGLEFCCDGKKSLEESCKDAGVSIEEVKEALEALPENGVPASQDYANWGLDFLSDYIVNVHHKYVTDSIPMLTDLSHKIATVHGNAHPELFKIKKHVDVLLSEMKAHQEEEENVLFPYIRQMVQLEKGGKPLAEPGFGDIENPVEMMLEDHKAVADHVHAIEKLSDGYKVPADGCDSYRLYFHKLYELDEDLHHHIHLENNVLFPKAVKMHKALAN